MPIEARFTWVQEMGSEMQDYHFSYPVKRDPAEAQRVITAAVYKTLACHEVTTREQRRFVRDASFIRDEETEVLARGLMDTLRQVTSERSGYQEEWDEARSQGRRAAEAVKSGKEWQVHYDYWKLRPVKSPMVYID